MAPLKRICNVVVVCVVVVASVCQTHAAAWSRPGVDNQNTGSTSLPITTGGHPQWSYDTESTVTAGVALNSAGSRLYVATGDGMLYSLKVETVDDSSDDIATGFGDGVEKEWSHTFSGAFTVAPVLSPDETEIYIGDAQGTFYSVSTANGQVNWAFFAGSAVTSTATVTDDLVFFGVSEVMYAMYRTNATTMWKCATKGQITGAPAVSSDGRSLFFGSTDTYVYGFNDVYDTTCLPSGTTTSSCLSQVHVSKHMDVNRTGCASWWLSPTNIAVSNALTLDESNNRLLLATEASPPEESSIVSVQLGAVTSGAQNNAWEVSTTLASSGYSIQTGVTLVSNETLAYGSDDGELHLINSWTGAQVWAYHTDAAIVSTPVTNGEYLTFGGTDNNIHAVSVASGSGVWAYSCGVAVAAPPALAASGMVIIGDTSGTVHAVGTVDVTIVRFIIGGIIAVFVVGCCVAGACVWRYRKQNRTPAIKSLDRDALASSPADTSAYTRMMADSEDVNL